MKTGTICIYGGAVLTIFMGIFHTQFYRLFKWGPMMETIGFPNSKIIYTIHIFLMLLFFIIAAISLLFAPELGRSEGLSMGINAGLALFWLTRAVWQLVYFDGNRGAVYYGMTVFFLLTMAAYATPLLLKWRS